MSVSVGSLFRCRRIACLVLALVLVTTVEDARQQGFGSEPDPEQTPMEATGSSETSTPSFSFVVVGHPRGAVSGRSHTHFEEALERIRDRQVDFMIITGDLIEGDYWSHPADEGVIVHDWDRLDARLRTLDIPIQRVPGNHDIHDPVTRRVFLDRYGEVPRTFAFNRSLFVLLDTVGIEHISKTPLSPNEYRRWSFGSQLDGKQLAFLHQALESQGDFDHVFLFTHHALWRDRDAAWWRDVHPLLKNSKVRGVFAGNPNGFKYAHTLEDGIHYIQSSLFRTPPMDVVMSDLGHMRMCAQFDNMQHVRVSGENVDIETVVLGALASESLSYDYWHTLARERRAGILRRLHAALGGPKRLLAALAATGLAGLCTGILLTRYWARRFLRVKRS